MGRYPHNNRNPDWTAPLPRYLVLIGRPRTPEADTPEINLLGIALKNRQITPRASFVY